MNPAARPANIDGGKGKPLAMETAGEAGEVLGNMDEASEAGVDGALFEAKAAANSLSRCCCNSRKKSLEPALPL